MPTNDPKLPSRQSESAAYHKAHLAFARTTIVQRAAERQPILDHLRRYTADVEESLLDRLEQDGLLPAGMTATDARKALDAFHIA